MGIQRGQLLSISVSIGGVGILVVGVKLLQGSGNGINQGFGVLQGQPDVLVVFLFLVVPMVLMVLFFRLHAFHSFFLFYGIPQDLQQVYDLPVLVASAFQSVLHPAVGLAAYIDKQVAVGELDEIVGGGLIAVQVNPLVQQHGDFGAVRLVPQNFTDPVVFREDGGDYADLLFRGRLGLGPSRRGCNSRHFSLIRAAGQNSHQHQSREQCGKNILHIDILQIIRTKFVKWAQKYKGKRQRRKSLS